MELIYSELAFLSIYNSLLQRLHLRIASFKYQD